MIPLPVVSPTVTGTVITAPGEALTFGNAAVTGGVPVGVAVAVGVNVFVAVGVGPSGSISTEPFSQPLPTGR